MHRRPFPLSSSCLKKKEARRASGLAADVARLKPTYLRKNRWQLADIQLVTWSIIDNGGAAPLVTLLRLTSGVPHRAPDEAINRA